MRQLSVFAVLGLFLAGLIGSASAANPFTVADRGWISVTGEVASANGNTFTLDYGTGVITVETDDWDSISDAPPITAGERVTVYGRVDADFYQRRTIEASGVYAYSRNTLYSTGSSADEEDPYPVYVTAPVVEEGTFLSLTGEVKRKTGREFVLDTGTERISVDTISMAYNPLDDIGYQQVDTGDLVRVSGVVDISLFDENELAATSITTLYDKSEVD